MNILFTICARAGSKGIKNKNLKRFLNFPLPFYTVSVIDLFVRNNPDINYDVVLNTDSDELKYLFKNTICLDIDIIDRDSILSQDDTPKIAVVRNCMEMMKHRKGLDYDMIVDLDITSPLRTVSDLAGLIQKKMISKADIVFSVTNSRRNPFFNMVKKTDNGYERVITSEFNARQEAPEIYDMNASLYAYSPNFLRSGKSIFQGKCDIIKMFDTAVLDLDHENDFELMQVIAAYLFKNYTSFGEIQDNIGCIIK